VVCVLEVFCKEDIAEVQECRQLRNGEVPHAPRVLVLVGDAGVQDEPPPWGSGFVNGTERLNEEGKGTADGNHLNDTLPDPGRELGAESNLSCRVPLPAGVVGPARMAEREAGLGHGHSALHHRGCDGVEWAKALVPLSGGHEDRHNVPNRCLLETDVLGEEAGLGASGEEPKPSGGSGTQTRKD
jgi:hypothetical protein